MTCPKYVNKPFQRLPLKKRACLILHLAGLSTRQIEKAIETDHVTVSRYINEGYDEYGNYFETNLASMDFLEKNNGK